MIQFYASELTETLTLGPEESSHCVRVLRKKEGDIIYVTDGHGFRYRCRLIKADPRKVSVEVLDREEVKKGWNNKITLIIAPTKNADRMAWLVEKATEIGVDQICFAHCRNSERKTVNVERLRRNAISAMNQSLKTRLPEINEMDSLLSLLYKDGEKYFGYCDSATERKSFAKEYAPNSDVTVAIGPEGDFSPEEVAAMRDASFLAVTFGDERLRTETAALYAVTAIHVINNL